MTDNEMLQAMRSMMKEELEPVRADIVELKQGQTRLEVKVSSLDEKVSSLDEKVSSLDEKVSSLDEKVSSLDEKVSSLDEKVSSLDEKVSSLDEKVETVHSSQIRIETMEFKRIGAALDGVLSGREKNEEQDNRIFRLENKIQKHDTEISYMKAQKAK